MRLKCDCASCQLHVHVHVHVIRLVIRPGSWTCAVCRACRALALAFMLSLWFSKQPQLARAHTPSYHLKQSSKKRKRGLEAGWKDPERLLINQYNIKPTPHKEERKKREGWDIEKRWIEKWKKGESPIKILKEKCELQQQQKQQQNRAIFFIILFKKTKKLKLSQDFENSKPTNC